MFVLQAVIKDFRDADFYKNRVRQIEIILKLTRLYLNISKFLQTGIFCNNFFYNSCIK